MPPARSFNHRQIFSLAIPMIISNISTPLLGLVDTAVMGHLDSPRFLAGIALGSMIFSFIFWGFGFLRMGTTGLTAQAFGRKNYDDIRSILALSLIMSSIIAVMLLLLQYPIRGLSFFLIESTAVTEGLAGSYFDIRIWSSPATLAHYVLLGWFLGLQDVRSPLFIVITTNLLNIILDIILVVGMDAGIRGVALASVIAEYGGLVPGILLVARRLKYNPGVLNVSSLLDTVNLKQLLIVNRNIFIRTLCLIFTFAFFTAQGAKLGVTILAANTVLLNFQLFIAFALDGFAHAAEALTGRAVGSSNTLLFRQTVLTAGFWSFFFALTFSLIFTLYGQSIINLLTGLKEVRLIAGNYLPWVILTPIASFGCYLLDGIFIGATLSREMRNTMVFSTLFCFIPIWYYTQSMQNHGLWLSLTVFMLARTVSMVWVFQKQPVYKKLFNQTYN